MKITVTITFEKCTPLQVHDFIDDQLDLGRWTKTDAVNFTQFKRIQHPESDMQCGGLTGLATFDLTEEKP